MLVTKLHKGKGQRGGVNKGSKLSITNTNTNINLPKITPKNLFKFVLTITAMTFSKH